jgi:hypothetical protein
VYEFLDSKAGCRWIAPDIEIVPANRDFAVPALDVRGRPAFSWRETTLYPRHDDPKRISKEDYARFLVRNRYNGGHFNGGSFWLYEPRFGFSERFGRPGSSHTFSIYQEKWQDVKPEFFAMMEDGKRAPRPTGPLGHDFCLTNAELKERVAQQLQQYIEEDRAEAAQKGTPPPRMYAFSQNDTSSKYCRCPECTAIAQREGSYAGTTLAFVNDIAARIAEKYPDVRLLTEAYQFTKRAPKMIRPRENVVVRLALLDLEYRADEIADVLRPLSAPTNRAAREVTEGWAKAIQDGQLFAWDYAQLRTPFRYPYDGTTKILKNLEYWHRLGIDRVFIEQAGIDLSFRPMRDWLFFRKSVHPELNDEVLIDEYVRGYFGPAAGPMGKYYDRLGDSLAELRVLHAGQRLARRSRSALCGRGERETSPPCAPGARAGRFRTSAPVAPLRGEPRVERPEGRGAAPLREEQAHVDSDLGHPRACLGQQRRRCFRWRTRRPALGAARPVCGPQRESAARRYR